MSTLQFVSHVQQDTVGRLYWFTHVHFHLGQPFWNL